MRACSVCDADIEKGEGLQEHDEIFCDEECLAEWEDGYVPYDGEDDYLIDGVGFADPGGTSALRAATPSNPRNLPCPTCGAPNRLTPADRARGYQCDSCADRAERGGW